VYTIHARFERFADVLVPDLIAATGVYVVWDSQARARPTYVGEGIVLKRIADHAAHGSRRFALPWDGYIALLSGSTRGVHKEEARVVERLLLDVASDTDRLPTVNAQPGAASVVTRCCSSETLRVSIEGFDPLVPPRESRPLQRAKTIQVRPLEGGSYEFEHDWRRRRVRKPV
jgi:hypothetical protein